MYVSFYCMFPLFLIVSGIFFHYSVLRVRCYNNIIIINAIFGKVGRLASEEVSLQLVKTKMSPNFTLRT